MEMKQVTVALDWTPNTNHVGFYAAKALGFYDRWSIAVRILSPHSDDYETTPAARVASKDATFGLGPSETLISHHSLPERSNLVAIAAVLQEDLSSIATLKKSGISRPRDLDGKRYASYAARYEGRIVQKMIQNDGGQGEFQEVVPAKLGTWNTLLQGEADATWVFSGWEGCAASLAGVELHEFKLSDYGIPYGYSPVLFCHRDTALESADMLVKFMRATKQGYAWAAQQPITRVTTTFLDQVKKEHPDLPKETLPSELVRKSLDSIRSSFLRDGQWGRMDSAVWESFLQWLQKEGLLTSHIQSRKPVPGKSVTLDELRQGNVGSPVPEDQIDVNKLYTNGALEWADRGCWKTAPGFQLPILEP